MTKKVSDKLTKQKLEICKNCDKLVKSDKCPDRCGLCGCEVERSTLYNIKCPIGKF